MGQIFMRVRRFCTALLFTVLLAGHIVIAPVLAKADEPTVLRVAFPQIEGFTMTDEHGRRHGLVVDFLNEIAKYTGWEYEYIDTDSEYLHEDFLAGKYDLMGGSFYSSGLEGLYAYPDFSTGKAKSVLLARWDDTSIRGFDLKDLNGKTIGVYEQATENIRRLEEFLSINGLDCTIKKYGPEERRDNSLYYLLENGEVDLLLGNTRDDTGRFRSAAYFDAQSHYIVTAPDNQKVLDELNWAMGQIMESNPNFAAECYAANFPGSGEISVFLNEEEKAYIQEKGTVTVMLPPDYHPLFCLNNPDRIHDGMLPDVLARISDFSGLKFAYTYADNYAAAIEGLKQGKADMAGFFLGSEADASLEGVSLTQSYVTLSNMVVRHKSVSYPSEGLTCGILQGREVPPDIPASEVHYFSNVHEALLAVNQGDVDFFYGLSSQIETELQNNYLPNAVPVSLWGHSDKISFALTKPADTKLLTIINKALTNLPDNELNSIVNQNMISLGASSLHISDFIYANPVLFVLVISGILLLIVTVLAVVARSRLKLEKAEADSRAKSAFLSRMSHEIRTPMNAIVGLTDLIHASEGVPEAVQANLSKLHASSRYLLSLINDILDMSRIDSGMMSIASEPFSLVQMLDDLESMMGAQAKRRGQKLCVEAKIQHPDLTGDAVRLRQVLTNLLSNALKFTASGDCVKLQVTEDGADDAGATFSFHVLDNGVGITPEDQARIFDVFEQVGSNISKSQGTGLGLPISRNIVRLMGGELELVSEVGKGSEFYFTITLPFGTPVEKKEAILSSGLLENARFLLVEDNELNAEIATELLQMQGAKITPAVNGRQAVELFSSSEPDAFDAVLMDIQMPVMNGLEAARTIRGLKRPDAATIPIVAMTANSFQEDIDAAKDAGMNGFITKPLDVDYLYRVLRELLEKHPRESF